MLRAIYQETRPMLTLALPMILSQLLGYAQIVVDTIMSGRHSALTLAGVSLGGQIYSLIYVLMIGIGIGLTTQLSHHHGRDHRGDIRHDFQQGLWLFAVLGVVTAILTALSAYIPQLIGSKPEIAQEAKRYLLTLALPAGIFLASAPGRCFLEGMAAPRDNNLLIAALIPLNILGNWYFLNHTTLGVQGMAIATGICYILYALGIFMLLSRNPRWRRYRLFHKIAPIDWQTFVRLIKVGLPIGAAIVMEVMMFQFVGFMVSRENTIVTGANQIAMNYNGIIFMVPLGIAAALTIRVANAQGKGDHNMMRVRALTGMALSIAFIIPVCFCSYFLREEIAHIYSDDRAIVTITAQLLIVTAIFQFFDGLQIAAAGILRGLSDTRITLLYAFIGYWLIGIPTSVLCAYGLGYGVIGLWIGLGIGVAIFSLLAGYRVYQHVARAS